MRMHDKDRKTEYEIYLEDARRNEVKHPNPHNRDQLVRSTLFWVVTLALRFKRKYPDSDLMDTIQRGNMGAVHAASKFLPEKNCAFTTYATNWIFTYMVRGHMCESRNIYIPLKVQLDAARYGIALPAETSLDDTSHGTMAEAEYDCNTLAGTMADNAPTPEEEVLAHRRIDSCIDAIMSLSYNEAKVLWGRLVNGESLKDVANQVKSSQGAKQSITKERARQIEQKALAKVQAILGAEVTGRRERGRVFSDV